MYFNEKELADLKAKGIGPCLNKHLGFVCTLRSDHGPSEHEAYNSHDNATANWAYHLGTPQVLTEPAEGDIKESS